MSDTPKTDAGLLWATHILRRPTSTPGMAVVEAGLARDLERQNAELRGVLADIQWGSGERCPCCCAWSSDYVEPGSRLRGSGQHTPSCRLLAALTRHAAGKNKEGP